MAARQGTVSLIESGRGQIICHYTLSLHEQIDVITCDSAVNAGAGRGEREAAAILCERSDCLLLIPVWIARLLTHRSLSLPLSLTLFLSPGFPALNCSTAITV